MKSIVMYRGTTLEQPILLSNYQVIEDSVDEFLFGIKKSYDDKNYVLSKKLSYNAIGQGIVIMLTPNETKDIVCGNYIYDIGLKRTINGIEEYHIIVPPSHFVIKPTVTTMP